MSGVKSQVMCPDLGCGRLPYSFDADSRHKRNLPRLVVGFSEFGLLAYGVCGKAGVLKCTSNVGVACMLAVN